MALIASFSLDRLADGPALMAGYALGTLLLLGLAHAHRRFPGSRAVSLVRFAGPLLLLPFAYNAAAGTVLALHGRYVDDGVRAFEQALFGFSPNLAVGAIAVPPLTELLTFCYFCYYGCFFLPIILYVRGRRPLAERYLFAVMAALLTCYVGFIAVPLAGPAAGEFAGERPAGYVITALQNHIMTTFDPPGACFPSAHVAGAWITLLCLRRHVSEIARRLLWALTAGLTVAVVYDWYHYLSDVVAGLAVALAVYAVTKRFAARPAPPARPRTLA
ncbi:phosphatase PAP2 family protein [Nonomuraea sp. NPDC050404]|uniref:phosphatase PAP2 family protein n=1 Tax=Nonomuraea sp. NPDC050404 TaxID=3155783 RepID=UPI0033C631DC